MSYIFIDELDDKQKRILLYSIPDLLKEIQAKGESYTNKRINVDHVTYFYEDVMYDRDKYPIKTVLIHGRYILSYAITDVWYMGPELVLAEQLLFKLPDRLATGSGNPFPVIEQLAKEHGAHRILLSDALGSEKTLGRLYQRGGYTKIASEYVKEVNYGNHIPDSGRVVSDPVQ